MLVMLKLDAFQRIARLDQIDRLADNNKMPDWDGLGVLRLISEEPIYHWFELRILKVIHEMEVDLVLAFLAAARVTKLEWNAKPDQVW